MKRLMTIVLSLMMVLAMSATAFAAGISESHAQKKALKSAGLSKSQLRSIEIDIDDDTGNYEVEFIRKSNKAEYDFEIDSDSGKVVKKSIEYRYKKNTSKDKIGKTAARKKAAKYTGIKLSTIKKGTCYYDYDDDDRVGKYEIKFTKGNYKYDLEILAATGKVIDYEKELINR